MSIYFVSVSVWLIIPDVCAFIQMIDTRCLSTEELADLMAAFLPTEWNHHTDYRFPAAQALKHIPAALDLRVTDRKEECPPTAESFV